MKKMIIALSLTAVISIGMTSAYAQGPGFGPGPKGMHSQESWGPGRGLNLTPEQKTKFQELRRNFRAENAQLIGAIVAKRLELQSLWTDSKAESRAILDKEKELRDLQNQMRDKRVQLRLEARKFLTPEQISKFGSRWGMRKGFCGGQRRGHGYRGHGMGHGMGPWMGHGMGPGPGTRQ